MQAVSAAAVALGCSPGALEAAEAAGLVRLAADDLVFRHPLVRAAVYHAASPAEQRAAHAALAAVLEGDRRAWQLAAAAAGADEVAAEALQEAAERAGARGSFALQLQALERAVELSVDGDARVGRLLAASRAASGAGEHARALELVELALPQATHPLVHADLRHQQAAIALAQGLPFSEDAVFEEAHRVEPLDAERAAGLLGLILAHRVAALDTAGALELAERREALSSSQGTLGDLLTARTLHGDARAALELLPGLVAEPERAAEQAPSLILLERYGEAQLVLAVSLERARSRGRPREIAWLQACQALLELAPGASPSSWRRRRRPASWPRSWARRTSWPSPSRRSRSWRPSRAAPLRAASTPPRRSRWVRRARTRGRAAGRGSPWGCWRSALGGPRRRWSSSSRSRRCRRAPG